MSTTTTTTNLTEATEAQRFAVEIDSEIADLNAQINRLDHQIADAEAAVIRAAGGTRVGVSGWSISFLDARDIVDASDSPGFLLTRHNDLVIARDVLCLRRWDLHQIHGEHEWSRFFLVTNSNGHIHRSTSCSTCFSTTEYAWLTDLSGRSEAEAVEALGEILCSVCFPSAPVEWTNGESNEVKRTRAEREAAKAERAAKKVAKALIPEDPEGGYLTTVGRDRIKTVAAAKTWLTDWAWWKHEYARPAETMGQDHPWMSTADAEALAALMIGRPGVKETTVEDVLAAARKRAAKR
jgi:hypothetical protein